MMPLKKPPAALNLSGIRLSFSVIASMTPMIPSKTFLIELSFPNALTNAPLMLSSTGGSFSLTNTIASLTASIAVMVNPIAVGMALVNMKLR